MRLQFLYTLCCNPYTLLSEIPEQTKYLSVVDLKDGFYCLPLMEESQFIFALEDSTQPSSQLSWAVCPWYLVTVLFYLDSLSQDPQSFRSSEVVVLQYVNDIFLCAETEEVVCEPQRFLKHSGSLWLQGIKRKDSALSTIRLIWA